MHQYDINSGSTNQPSEQRTRKVVLTGRHKTEKGPTTEKHQLSKNIYNILHMNTQKTTDN